MKYVLAFDGSPKLAGNTNDIIDKILEGARTAEVKIEKVHLNSIKMDGCQAIETCRITGVCAHRDSFTPYYEKINGADCIIIASPIYFERVTGQMKCFIDRLYPYLDESFNSRMRRGKKCVIAMNWAASAPVHGMGELDFWATFFARHMEVVAKIGVAGTARPGDFLRNSKAVNEANQAGAALVK
jgi:multimeric flavodoxin WrbA